MHNTSKQRRMKGVNEWWLVIVSGAIVSGAIVSGAIVSGAPVDDGVIVVSNILLQADHELPDILQQTVVAGKLKVSCRRGVN